MRQTPKVLEVKERARVPLYHHAMIEPAARRSAAIEARGHSELGALGTEGVRNWGRNRAVKTNRLVCLSVCLSVCL